MAAIHLTCPALQFTDRAKTRVEIPAAMAAALGKALWHVSKTIYEDEERRQKDAERQQRRERERAQRSAPPKLSLREAVFQELWVAYWDATGQGYYPISARNLYYAVRPLILPLVKRETLEYEYFAQTLLVDYQRAIRKLPRLYYDPRGVLYEPHTGKAIQLGTREVEAYRFPSWLYNKILYVEKKGVWPVLQAAQLAERYDMAIVVGEGYANEAARVLFADADQGHDYQLFVLHDADPYGYNIARTLREETRRMPGHQVNVLDLGLRYAEAKAMGLESEQFTRKKALPAELEPLLTAAERKAFVGKAASVNRSGQPNSWICERVEINALTPPDLIAYIERELAAHEAIGKVIPDDAPLRQAVRDLYAETLNDWVDERIAELLNVGTIQATLRDAFREPFGIGDGDDVPAEWRERIEHGFEQDRARSWKAVVRSALSETLATERDALRDRCRELLLEQCSKLADGTD